MPSIQEIMRNASPEVRQMNSKELDALLAKREEKAEISEHEMQVALFRWIDANLERYPELRLAFAVPNGGHRHPATAAKMKAEGVRRGVPDVLLLHPSADGRYCGGAWELKVRHNKPTLEQTSWHGRLQSVGYYAVVISDDWTAVALDMLAYLGYPQAAGNVGELPY